jgi:hypothetical protein
METINRTAFVITPNQAFLEWMHRADPTNSELTLEDARADASVLLVPEAESEEEALSYLKRHCDKIFEEQLGAWYTVESTWPARRDFETFKEWFDWSFHSVIFDVGDEPIVHEEF